MVLLTNCVLAQPGALDPTFGISGKISLSFPGRPILHQYIKLQPDKKILVLSVINGAFYPNDKYYYFLSRLLPNGQPDSSFGVNGRIIDSFVRAYAIALKPDGKILLTGATTDSSQDVILIRYSASGSIDNSFGVNGKVITSFKIPPGALWGTDVSTAVFVLPNGKILQGGYSLHGSSDYYFSNTRFLPNGTVDSTYGINGQAHMRANVYINFDINDGYTWERTPLQSLLDSSQRLVVADETGVVRFKQNGDIDSSFGLYGLASFQGYFQWSSGLVQPDGKMVFSSLYYLNGSPTIVVLNRLNVDGSRDTSFKMIPIVKPPFIPDVLISKIILLPNGQYAFLFKTKYRQVAANTTWGIARINSNGTPDSAFGINGILYTDDPLSYGAAFQPDGKLIAGGSSLQYTNSPGTIARFENILPNNNYLNVDLYLDRNTNGSKDLGEPLFPAAFATASKPGGAGNVVANTSSGYFEIPVDTGNYTTVITPFKPYFNVSPPSLTTSHSTYFNHDAISVGLQPIPGNKDLAITIIPLSPLRPGGNVAYRVLCKNVGTDTVSGSFQLIKDTRLVYQFATRVPAAISGDTITWNFNNLAMLDTISAVVYLKALIPPILNMGDTIVCKAFTSTIAGEILTLDNQVVCNQAVTGAYDPNDKTENHGGRIALSKAVAGEYFTYTIRFQNTGNDTAFNVFIRDTMDSKLDWNSLQIVASSHNYQMTMNDGKCLFTFPLIMLVDSIKNEPKSHGYIVYKIKAKPNIQIGNVIKNTAAIYFDYNLPIYTNTEKTTVVTDLLLLKLLLFTAQKQEKTNLLNWTTSQEINLDKFEVERSNNGREFSKIGTVKAGQTQYSFTDVKPVMRNSNYYRLKMIDKDGQLTYSPVRMINFSTSFNVAIFPNPAKDNLQVQIDSDKPTVLQMQVVSIDGKVLLSNSFSSADGSTLRSINISSLQKGSYLLKVNDDKEEQTLKFEKL